MGRKIVIDYEQQLKWKNIEIVYPFCIKYGSDQKGYSYCRHLEDGRYEYLCCEPLKMHFSYGNQINNIPVLINNDEYWYKQLANLHKTITNEEFETARKQFFDKYQNYLNGTEYIAKDVKQLLSNQANHYKIEEQQIEEKLEQLPDNGIIINNRADDPF